MQGGLNVAEFGLRIDGKAAIRTLNQFSASAHNAGRATEKFERTTKNLTATLAGLGGYFGVRQMVEYADTWTLIGNRIDVVTKTQEEQATVQEKLYKIANRTRNTLAATSVLYTRVALNADQLGVSHQDLLDVTEAVNAAMLISGSTGVESAQAMRQFAQALGSGRVQGDEFRTMMEAMPVVARAVADEMGVSFGELYKLSKDGLIDVNTVIDALLDKHAELVATADGMRWTVGQAYEVLNNAMTRMVGIMNDAFQLSDQFADGLSWVADNMNKVMSGALAMTSAILVYKAAAMSTFLVQQLLVGRKMILGIIATTRALEGAARAQFLWSTFGKGMLTVIPAIAALTIGVIAYNKALQEINAATERWLSNNADLSGLLGAGSDPVDDKTIKALQAAEDRVRNAHQEVVLASVMEEQQARLAIAFDAVNARIEARRDLQGDVLDTMLEAIDLEEKLGIEAYETGLVMEELADNIKEQEKIIERFAKNLQREFANVFEDVFSNGVEKFSDLFNVIKKLFFRLVAEMASAKLMAKVGGTLTTALTGMLVNTEELAASKELSNVYGMHAQGTHMDKATKSGLRLSPDGTVPIRVEGITVTAEQSLASKIAGALGPIMAGFAIGRMVGGLTTNKKLGAAGGALSGAAAGALVGSVIPGIGTVVGGVLGGLAGAIGGYMGASKRQREEEEKLRKAITEMTDILMANNQKLQAMRDAFAGRENAELLATRELFDSSIINPAMFNNLAQQLGITLYDSAGNVVVGAMEQFREAIELAVQALTMWGSNLDDIRKQQSSYNAIFGVEDTPEQNLQDQYNILSQAAPDLMRMLGLENLNLNSPEARAVFLEGLKDIWRMVDNGEFFNDPALLGAFSDKNQLIDAAVAAAKALDEFGKTVLDITTDFPRVADIPFYEQAFGTFGTGEETSMPTDYNSGSGEDGSGVAGGDLIINGGVTIINQSGDDGETLLTKLEDAVITRRSTGGSVDFDRSGETLF